MQRLKIGWELGHYRKRGGKPAFAYWRIMCHESASGALDYCGMGIIEMSEDGGSNIATTTLAIAGSAPYSGQEADKSFDGADNTYWGSRYSSKYPDTWVGQNFGSKKAIASVAITAINGSRTDRAPTKFDIDASDDGITWQTMLSVNDPTVWGNAERRVYVL